MKKNAKNKKLIVAAALALLAIVTIVISVLVLIPGADTPQTGENGDGNDAKKALNAFIKNVESSDPTTYDCTVVYTADGITLNGKYRLEISSVYGEKHALLTYEYDRLNEIGESDDFITTVTGSLSAIGDENIGAMTDSAIDISSGRIPLKVAPLALSPDMFKSHGITENGESKVLEATLKDALLGNGTKDILLAIECDAEGGDMTRVSVSYTDPYGASVSVVCIFSSE